MKKNKNILAFVIIFALAVIGLQLRPTQVNETIKGMIITLGSDEMLQAEMKLEGQMKLKGFEKRGGRLGQNAAVVNRYQRKRVRMMSHWINYKTKTSLLTISIFMLNNRNMISFRQIAFLKRVPFFLTLR